MHLRLFLVRHGETVDNVAGIIAGVRDSQLTSHGFQQARRLGNYLNASEVDITHIFASPLQRAATTAEQIWLAQPDPLRKKVSVVPSSLILEQDFGLYEGVTYGEYRASDERHLSVETSQMMVRRADMFIEQYLIPILEGNTSATVVLVAHGRILPVIWSRILAWLKPGLVTCDRQLLIDTSSLDYTRINSWSNTGFLEATFTRKVLQTPERVSNGSITTVAEGKAPELVTAPSLESKPMSSWEGNISTINGRHHLSGFVRTKGGVGSSRYDSQQTTLDKFFVGRRSAG